MKRTLLIYCVLVFALSGCGGTDSADTTTAATAAATTTTTTSAVIPTADVGDPSNWPLTAPPPNLPVTFTDGIGNEVTVTKIDRIGSMFGAASEALWTMGFGDRLVVIEGTTQYPPEIASLPNVGFFRALPAEGILAEAPDVLFVSPDAGPPEVLESIEAAGVAVVRLPEITSDVESFQAMVELIGLAVGTPEHAAVFADAVTKACLDVAVEPAGDAPVVLYAVARGQNVMLTGLDSPSNSLIAGAGFRSAAAVLGMETAAPLTPEAIVVANPEVILTTRSSVNQAGGEDAFMAVPGIAESSAGQSGALIIWEDDSEIQQWTPRSAAAIVRLRELIAELTS